jgi:hypothetical protein
VCANFGIMAGVIVSRPWWSNGCVVAVPVEHSLGFSGDRRGSRQFRRMNDCGRLHSADRWQELSRELTAIVPFLHRCGHVLPYGSSPRAVLPGGINLTFTGPEVFSAGGSVRRDEGARYLVVDAAPRMSTVCVTTVAVELYISHHRSRGYRHERCVVSTSSHARAWIERGCGPADGDAK